MVLYTTIGSRNIPEEGIRVTKTEALKYQKNIIKNWKSLGDIFFLQYGSFVSSAFTFASSVYITRAIRSLLNIGSHAKLVPYIMTAKVPAILSYMWTEKKVTENTLLMSAGCPMCQQVMFGIGQTVLSVIFPVVTSFVVYIPVGQYHNTIALPDISRDTRKAFPFCFKLVRAKSLQFQIVAALQLPLIFLLPYLQAKDLDKVTKILRSGTHTEIRDIVK